MTIAVNPERQKKFSTIYLLVLFSGMAALSWTVIWQIQSSLALGVSAWGTALTLAVTMAGMCIGALIAGYALRARPAVNALRLYGVLEILIGVSGLLLLPALKQAEVFDIQSYKTMAGGHFWVHITGIALSMGFPAICMGATTPVFGLIARTYGSSISILYGLNTLGAAVGSILAAFIIIPWAGVLGTTYFIASVNLLVGAYALSFGKKSESADAMEKQSVLLGSQEFKSWQKYLLVFVTGFSTLALEVAWFRSFTAAFWSTTAAFSIMLASVLVSLGVAAHLVPLLRKKGASLAVCVTLAGISILLATPLVERFDLLTRINSVNPVFLFMNWFFLSFYVTAIPITLLGLALPWVLDSENSARSWAALYGVNTLAAVFGSLLAGWLLLPSIGFARTSWIVGTIVLFSGLILSGPLPKTKARLFLIGLAALALAVFFESGVGRTRVQMHTAKNTNNMPEILDSAEGPDATVSVVEFSKSKERALIIDGFIATTQSSDEGSGFAMQYMLWMGHLPMLMHPDPKAALVICFGTGQTANALRKENPQSLTIVDVNENVYRMADYFKSNEAVLKDPRVKSIVMDGRAFMRRTEKEFDIITLEPMPPTFAGVNALYSKEFYELAKRKLTEKGVIAQWLPFHLLSVYHSASISRTFSEVFPNSVLWIDPQSLTGILLGSKDETTLLGQNFPGLERNRMVRLLPDEKIGEAVYFNPRELKIYGEEYGDIVTDDNQLLSYGSSNFAIHSDPNNLMRDNYDTLKALKSRLVKNAKAEIENY